MAARYESVTLYIVSELNLDSLTAVLSPHADTLARQVTIPNISKNFFISSIFLSLIHHIAACFLSGISTAFVYNISKAPITYFLVSSGAIIVSTRPLLAAEATPF